MEDTLKTFVALDQRVRSVSVLYSLLDSSGSFAELRRDRIGKDRGARGVFLENMGDRPDAGAGPCIPDRRQF